MKKEKRKNIFVIPLSFLGFSITMITTGCSLFTGNRSDNWFNFVNPYKPKTEQKNNNQAHLENTVPKDTPYEIINKLSFSLIIANRGGRNDNDKLGETEGRRGPYFAYGTGWLFDYNRNPLENPDGSFNWTGYFATNLHVANSTLNPNETNPNYLAPAFKNPLWWKNSDYTQSFYLNRYDPNLHEESSKPSDPFLPRTEPRVHGVKLTYIPTTQFAAIGLQNEATTLEGNRFYLDFAVLKVVIRFTKNPSTLSELAEDLLYESWIKPAVKTLDDYYFNQNVSFFDTTNYLQSGLSNINGYIGGYPVKDSRNGFSAKPVWTINADHNAKQFDGQPIDNSGTSGFERVTNSPINGLINNTSVPNFTFNFRGEKYHKTGVSYYVKNSNLGGGSSGSVLLAQNTRTKKTAQALGIYFGTLASQEGGESSYGFADALFLNTNTNNKNIYKNQGLFSYDLINGKNQSYKANLGPDEDTKMFPKSDNDIPNDETQ